MLVGERRRQLLVSLYRRRRSRLVADVGVDVDDVESALCRVGGGISAVSSFGFETSLSFVIFSIFSLTLFCFLCNSDAQLVSTLHFRGYFIMMMQSLLSPLLVSKSPPSLSKSPHSNTQPSSSSSSSSSTEKSLLPPAVSLSSSGDSWLLYDGVLGSRF